jgi:hypothetical protein
LLEAATTAREAGLQEYLGIALCWLGEVTAATGDYSQAEQWLIESANILAKLQHNIAASPLVWLSYTARAQANAEGARRRMGQALRLMQDRRSVLSVYECLPVAALLAADRGAVARAAELHALSRTFPNVANSRWVYDTAGRQLDEVVSRLPAEVATAAIARGRTLDLWQTLEALAAEFTPG